MTTQTLHRASYPIGHACEILNLNASQMKELLNAGVLDHAADGVQICAKSMDAYRNPSESEWLHGPRNPIVANASKLAALAGRMEAAQSEPEELTEADVEAEPKQEPVAEPGYRFLTLQEEVFAGDEVFRNGKWVPSDAFRNGYQRAIGLTYRRHVDPDGWSVWSGGHQCPVESDAVVEIRWRAGGDKVVGGPAGAFMWSHAGNHPWEVVAFRELPPDPQVVADFADVEAGGWIDWPGGECPVFGRAFVEFETRFGTTGKRRAHEFVWQHGMLEIVAYRVVPADQPAEPVSDEQADAVIRDAVQITEKQRRVYYQDIVYKVCDFIDSKIGGRTVCGTVENPTNEVADRLAQAWKEAVLIVESDQPAEPEKQPQPGWYMVGIGKRGPYLYVGPDDEGDLVFQTGKNTFENFVWDVECRHLPNCTGFDYVPPPEQTPAEKRLAAVGVKRDTDGDYWSSEYQTLLAISDFTVDQIEAIAAHMREREGGPECS